MRKMFILLLMVLLIPQALAFETSNSEYTTQIIFTGGSGTVSNANYSTTMNIGQMIIGSTSNTVYNTTLGFFSILLYDETAPVITVLSPVNTTTLDHTPLLNVTLDDVSNLTYSIDGGANLSACNYCTSYLADGGYEYTGTHIITYYAVNMDFVIGESSVVWSITDHVDGGGGEEPIPPPEEPPETNITDPVEVILPPADKSIFDRTINWLDEELYVSDDRCSAYNYTLVDVNDTQPKYELTCVEYFTLSRWYAVLPIVLIIIFVFGARYYEYFWLIAQKKVLRKKGSKKQVEGYIDRKNSKKYND